MRVLIVEDNPLIALDIADEVEGAGAAVVGVAHSGHLARALIELLHPDLVFLDYTLADDITGADIAAGLDRNGPAIVFVTGTPESVPESVAARWPVLLKPITAAEIRRVLEFVRELNVSTETLDG